MSSSSSSTQAHQTSTTTVSNLNIQDVEGVTVVDSTGTTITMTDHGAIKVAGDFAAGALDAAARVVRDATDLGYSALGVVGDANAAMESTARAALVEGFDFGRDALGMADAASRLAVVESMDFGRDALGVVDSSTRFSLVESLDFARDMFAGAVEAAGGALESAQAQVAETTAALGAIAREQATSESTRMQQLALGVVAAFALVMIFARARGG